MDMNDVRSLVTLLSFTLFLGLMAWSWWPARRGIYDAAARLPFEGEAPEPAFDQDAMACEPECRAQVKGLR